jgi:hypothetical protein
MVPVRIFANVVAGSIIGRNSAASHFLTCPETLYSKPEVGAHIRRPFYRAVGTLFLSVSTMEKRAPSTISDNVTLVSANVSSMCNDRPDILKVYPNKAIVYSAGSPAWQRRQMVPGFERILVKRGANAGTGIGEVGGKGERSENRLR